MCLRGTPARDAAPVVAENDAMVSAIGSKMPSFNGIATPSTIRRDTVRIQDEYAKGSPVRRISVKTMPDRYLDGTALANRLTSWLLERYGRDQLLSRKGGVDELSLYAGMPTGGPSKEQHEAIADWYLKQGPDSITPEGFIQKCVEVAEGKVLLGLTIAWNALQCLDDDYYPTWESPRRNSLPESRKLIDITGEREWNLKLKLDTWNNNKFPVVFGLGGSLAARGDNYSAWYHFLGVAIAAFSNAISLAAKLLPGDARSEAARSYARFLVHLEEDVFFPHHLDPLKRKNIDFAGADFGAQLADNLRRFASAEAYQGSPEAQATTYLYDNPKVYGPKWALRRGELPTEFPPAVIASLNGLHSGKSPARGAPLSA